MCFLQITQSVAGSFLNLVGQNPELADTPGWAYVPEWAYTLCWKDVPGWASAPV